MKCLYLLLLAFTSFGSLNAQKKVVILGSSTAAGGNATTFDSSWVGRLQSYFRRNITQGNPDTIVTNLAQAGFYTFNVMPSWYTPPIPSYPQVAPFYNISRAIFLNPDVIIVNLPSNDAVYPFPNWMTMNNFRMIFNEAVINNKRIFITTSQPINDLNLNIRDSLRKIADSINLNFGQFAIDFWTPIVSPAGDSSIRADVNSDGRHVNNKGHRLLFEQVIAKELFPAMGPLPVKLISFDAIPGINSITLKWTTTGEEPFTKYEIQRSNNGRELSTIAVLNGNGNANAYTYSWTDQHPFEGKTYYRLKIIEPSKTSYSKIMVAGDNGSPFEIGSLYADANSLHIRINNSQGSFIEASLISLTGAIVKKQKLEISGGVVTMSTSDITPGEYIVRVADMKGNEATRRFIKLK